jgi:DNA-directed RNA polymerase subunit RPC12/RpoP
LGIKCDDFCPINQDLLIKEKNFMEKIKGMRAEQYEVVYHGDHKATLKCVYLCPYCKEKTNTQTTVQPEWFDLVESGFFSVAVDCGRCNKTADVRFVGIDRINPKSFGNNADTCESCQQSLARGDRSLPWEDGNNANAYIRCPHCGHKNIKYGFGEDD